MSRSIAVVVLPDDFPVQRIHEADDDGYFIPSATGDGFNLPQILDGCLLGPVIDGPDNSRYNEGESLSLGIRYRADSHPADLWIDLRYPVLDWVRIGSSWQQPDPRPVPADAKLYLFAYVHT